MNPRALFLHGAGAWGGQWAIWRRVFEAEGWRVDTPDFAPVPGGLAATRFEDYMAQAAGWLEEAPVALLVGASLGGLVATSAAARVAPSARSRALVLVNPLPPAPWATGLPPLDASGDVVPWRSQGRFASTRRALPEAAFTDQRLAFAHWRDESAAVLRAEIRAVEQKLRDAHAGGGGQIVEITPEQRAAWRAAVAPAWPEMVKAIGGQSDALYKAMEAARASCRG